MASEGNVSDALVLLAGAGSRLASKRGPVPKPLVEICGQPLISYVLRELDNVGIRNVHAVVGANAREVSAGVEKVLPAGMSLNVVHNAEWQKQNGVSVLCGASALDRPFLLTMGDHLFDGAILDLLLETARPAQLSLAVDRKVDSIFDLDDAMKVRTRGTRIVEISKHLRDFDAIDTGLFFAPPELFDYLARAKVNGDCSLANGVRLMARDDKARAVDIGDAWWQDVDTPEMWTEAERRLRTTDEQEFTPPRQASAA